MLSNVIIVNSLLKFGLKFCLNIVGNIDLVIVLELKLNGFVINFIFLIRLLLDIR